MSQDYRCSICGTYEIRSSGFNGSGSTLGDCKACDKTLQESEGSLRFAMRHGPMFPLPTNNERCRIASVFINRNRSLESLNFCLSSLDRSSSACSSHTNYDPVVALKELTRYKKSDFDPGSPPPVNLQSHTHPDLLYTLTLAAFTIYGPSTFAISCLRRAYISNPYLFQMLAENTFTAPRDHWNRIGLQIQDGGIYRLRFKPIWGASGVKEWLRESEEVVKKKACDAVECGKIEESVGEWKVCKGCMEWWYCGTECQERDWKVGGHKRTCKESKQRLRRWLGLEL